MMTLKLLVRAAVALAILFVVLAPAAAAPPEGAPGRYAAWYQALRSPTGGSCCDLSDCREVRWRAGKSGYEALISPETHGSVGATEAFWLPIPDNKIVTPPEFAREFDRPPGAVVCWARDHLYCFVRGMEG